jgi:hypothetical protein
LNLVTLQAKLLPVVSFDGILRPMSRALLLLVLWMQATLLCAQQNPRPFIEAGHAKYAAKDFDGAIAE